MVVNVVAESIHQLAFARQAVGVWSVAWGFLTNPQRACGHCEAVTQEKSMLCAWEFLGLQLAELRSPGFIRPLRGVRTANKYVVEEVRKLALIREDGLQ